VPAIITDFFAQETSTDSEIDLIVHSPSFLKLLKSVFNFCALVVSIKIIHILFSLVPQGRKDIAR
jgi:hypothetical protein